MTCSLQVTLSPCSVLLYPLELLLLPFLSFLEPLDPQLLERLILKVLLQLELVELLVEDEAVEERLVAVEVGALEGVEGWRLVGVAEEDLSWEDELDVFLVGAWVRIHAEQDLGTDLFDLAEGAREHCLRHS